MRKLMQLTMILFLVIGGSACSERESDQLVDNDAVYAGVEFDMPKVQEPEFPDYTVTITDFGAVGDGQTLNSTAIAEAIDHVAEKGGGKVIIPRGIWFTGPITMKSNINLYTESGALVVFSSDKDLFPLVETSFEGLNTVRCISPINGVNLENIAFTGNGVFDGSGDAWRFVKRSKMTDSQWKDLVKSGGIVSEDGKEWYPSEGFKLGMEISDMNVPRQFTKLEDYLPIKDFLRPVMVSIVKSNKVLFDGPTFQNSPAWCIHPLMCENLTVRNINVRNPWYSQNGDGLDIESCKNVVLVNSRFDVGDDAICIKSGKDKDGRDRGIPSENIIVKNCVVYHGHGGVTVGSEMSGGVKNMHVSGCTFIGTDVGLRFKSTRGRGGLVENIYMSDIDMVDIPTNAISFNLYYGGLSVSEMLAESTDADKQPAETIEVTEETPQFKNIHMKNITVKGAYQALYMQGLPEMNLENISLENLVLEAENGLVAIDADQISIKNCWLKTENTPAMTFYNTKNVIVEEIEIDGMPEHAVTIGGNASSGLHLDLDKNRVKIESNVNDESVSFAK